MIVNPVTTGAVLEFRILGPLEVLDGGTPVPLGGRNQRALLTLLLLRANEPVSTERLVDQLWGEHPPRTATDLAPEHGLAAAQAARARAPAHAAAGYLLELDGDQLDLAALRAARREARDAAEPPERAQAPARGARALARPALADSELEDVRAGRDPPARGAPARGAGGPDRRRPRVGADAELVAELEALVAGTRCASGCGRS